jgi:hypothetical protein
MKFSILVASAIFAGVSAAPVKRDVPTNLIPEFGFSAGRNPTGTGDCDGAVNGANGQPIKIPCACPPDRGDFIRKLNDNVRAGHATNNPGVGVSFPLGTSKEDQLARMNTALVTLQNLNGPGQGCPAVSTTFVAQQKAIAEFNAAAPPPPPPAPAPPAPAPAPAPQGGDVPANLIPDFGFSSGRNPTGTGDCDGAVIGGNGQPIKIPCACPPDRGDFIRKLNDNVRAGHATNNPGIAVSFPLGTSKGEQLARMQTALVTLQNLNGPGKGCPAASTTFLAQQKAIQDFNAAPAPAPAAPAPPPPPPAAPAGGDIASLAPDLGFSAGRNPTGTGDCDGAVNGPNGQPIKIPCACPPSRDAFLAALTTNINAGRPVNNPGIPFSFPRGDSKEDKIARIQASLVTLQNLNGPGKGCPASSTTLLAQQRALTG